MKETIIKIEFPLKRFSAPKRDRFYAMLPRRYRWFGWLYSWGGSSVGDCSGKTNTVRHLQLFRWHVLTVHRNEYHDRSDKERADEYLREWSKCERELRMFRIAAMGEDLSAEVKQVIKDAFAVDIDEGVQR